MTTQINIIVGPLSLKVENSRQSEANRFRRSEQDAQQQTQARATREKQRQLAQLEPVADSRSGSGRPRFLQQKPAAFRYGGPGFLLAPSGDYVGSLLSVTSTQFAPLFFSRYQPGGIGTVSGLPLVDFITTQGPGGALALTIPSGGFGFGYLFASEYPAGSGVDIRKIFFNPGYYPWGVVYPAYLLSDIPRQVVPLPELLNPAAAAKQFDSFTLEFMHRVGDQDGIYIETNNCRFELGYNNYFYLTLGLSGIESKSTSKGTIEYEGLYIQMVGTPDGYESQLQIPAQTIGTWHHYALCKDQSQFRFYIDGVLIVSGATASNYWDRYCAVYDSFQAYNVGDLPLMLAVYQASSVTSPAIHGLRFTPRARYIGSSFVPPSAITTLT